MDVLLVHLPLARPSYLAQFTLPEPLAQLYLAPVLRERHRLRFVDLRLQRLERALARDEDFRPKAALVGVSPLTVAALGPALAELRASFPGIKLLVHADAEYGNAHVSERPQDFLHPLADALVQPYFLARQREIVAAALGAWDEGREPRDVAGLWIREGETWHATTRVENRVGLIGVPDRTLLGPNRGRYRFGGIGRMAHLFYTYGCRFKCRFCPMSKHDGSIVNLPLDDVVQDLHAISEPHVYLEDFEPFLAPEAMSALADAVEREKIRKRWYMLTRADSALLQRDLIARWKGLGLSWLYLGLDGDSPRRLKELRKSTTPDINERALRSMLDLGLAVSVGFVVRSDYTQEDFAALRAYVKQLRAPLVTFTVETPLVGTTLFDETEKSLTTRDWSLFDLEHAVLPTTLPLEQFYRELTRLHVTAGMRTFPTMLRHYPLRDTALLWLTGWRGVQRLLRSARDHEPRGPEQLVAGTSAA